MPNKNRIDPATTSPGYEDYQCIGESTVTLNRDHIIPYEKIIRFINIILETADLRKKASNWITTALSTYKFNQAREKDVIFSNAIKFIIDYGILNKILDAKNDKDFDEKIYNQYESIFELKKVQKNDKKENRIKALLEYYFTTNESDKVKLELSASLNLTLLITKLALEQSLTKKQYLPSAFFTDDDEIYIKVDKVEDNYKNDTLTNNDKDIIKRATGWMPGNVFRAPRPKPQDKGNEFDCTVAATEIDLQQLIKYYKAYLQINSFFDNNTADENEAINILNDIATIKNLWPFIHKNWSYIPTDKGKYLYYPQKIFSMTFQTIEDNNSIIINIDDKFIQNNKNLSENNNSFSFLKNFKQTKH